MMTQYYYGRFLGEKICPECKGERLRTEVLSVLLGSKNINQVTSLTINEALSWVKSLWSQIDDERKTIAEELIAEIEGRLQFMMNVGLHYLTLDRSAPSLSGEWKKTYRNAFSPGCLDSLQCV